MQFQFDQTVIRVTHADAASLLADVSARLQAGQGFALATINLDHLVKLRAGGAFLAAYAAQDFVVADGNPVVWLSRLAGRPVGLVPGSDLVMPLVRAAAAAGRPLSLLGSTDLALEAAMARFQANVPGLRRGGGIRRRSADPRAAIGARVGDGVAVARAVVTAPDGAALCRLRRDPAGAGGEGLAAARRLTICIRSGHACARAACPSGSPARPKPLAACPER